MKRTELKKRLRGYLTTGQAAAIAGVRRDTVGAWCRAGWLKTDTVGGVYRIRRKDLNRYLSDPRKVGKPRKEV